MPAEIIQLINLASTPELDDTFPVTQSERLRRALDKIVRVYNFVYLETPDIDYQSRTVEAACLAFDNLNERGVTAQEFNIFLENLECHADWLHDHANKMVNRDDVDAERFRFEIAASNYCEPQYSKTFEFSVVATLSISLAIFGLVAMGSTFLLMTPLLPLYLAIATPIALIGVAALLVFLGSYLGHVLATVPADKKNALTDEKFEKFSSQFKGVNTLFSHPNARPLAVLPQQDYPAASMTPSEQM